MEFTNEETERTETNEEVNMFETESGIDAGLKARASSRLTDFFPPMSLLVE